jgi:hypothetical protein
LKIRHDLLLVEEEFFVDIIFDDGGWNGGVSTGYDRTGTRASWRRRNLVG